MGNVRIYRSTRRDCVCDQIASATMGHVPVEGARRTGRKCRDKTDTLEEAILPAICILAESSRQSGAFVCETRVATWLHDPPRRGF